jgi:S-methylmethionine-dependent homocysteine/selenocysteine methylase
MERLENRLKNGPPLLLDGALGTELERQGVSCELPLWSTRALLDCPERVGAIHDAYARAGAEILTANTFRTQRHTLEKCGMVPRAESLTTLAVDLARQAAESQEREIWVAGSAPTLEDCYRADLVPHARELSAGHRQHCEALLQAGVDFILIETMNSIAEARVAHDAVRSLGGRAMVAFSILVDGRLRSGETLEQAVAALAPEKPLALLLNCAPLSWISSHLSVLSSSGLPFGLYPNFGTPSTRPEVAWENPLAPEDFGELLSAETRKGARLAGGCCGTTPLHIEALSQALS